MTPSSDPLGRHAGKPRTKGVGRTVFAPLGRQVNIPFYARNRMRIWGNHDMINITESVIEAV